MKHPTYHYDKPLVPEHLTKLTIENCPLDRAFYVEPGERDDYEAPAVFVTPKRRLMMSRSHAIDIDDAYPAAPYGHVGVMRVAILDSMTSSIREAYIADLRFLEDHQLVDTDDVSNAMIDQESFMALAASFEDAVEITGFIAPEDNFDFDHKLPRGIFYGDPELHPFLKRLRKRGNKVMKRFMEREAKPNIPPKGDEIPSPPKVNDELAQPEKQKPQAPALAVKFLQPTDLS